MNTNPRRQRLLLCTILSIVLLLLSAVAVGAASQPSITGAGHMQKLGWRNISGSQVGVTGQSLRMEAFRLNLSNKNASGDITYRSYVQGKGWESSWVKNGATSGTTGKSLRLEAVQLKLTGDLAKKYDLYYRAHTEKFGWLDWAKNGASAGTSGYSYRIEALQVKLVAKGSAAPGSTKNPYKSKSTPKPTPAPSTTGRYWVTSNHNFHTTQNTLGHYTSLEAAKKALNAQPSSTRGQWYVYDRTAKKIVYPILTTNQQKISFAVAWCAAIANDNKHIYSSDGEWLADNLSFSLTTNPGPERWGLHGRYACSTMIAMAYEIAGYTNLRDICRKYQIRMSSYYRNRVGYNSTNMAKALLKTGKFTEITSTYRSKGSSALKPGDILLTRGEGHSAICIGKNRCAEAVGPGIITSNIGNSWGRVFRPKA